MDTLTFGQIIVAALPYLEGIIGLVLAGGWAKTWVTLRQTKKAAELENEASAVSLLEKDIERKIEEIKAKDDVIAQRDEKIASLNAIIESERTKRMQLFSQSVQMGMTMCVHLGCPYRKPGAGQGMQWYETHRTEANLGADTIGIDDIIREHTQSNG